MHLHSINILKYIHFVINLIDSSLKNDDKETLFFLLHLLSLLLLCKMNPFLSSTYFTSEEVHSISYKLTTMASNHVDRILKTKSCWRWR